MDFGVVKATFWCHFMEERLFQSLLVWRVVTLTFHCFSKMIFNSPTLIHETDSLVGSLQFQFGIFRVFGFWTMIDCHSIVLQYGCGIAHRYASNFKPSSETQNYLVWFEFAKPQFFRMFFVLGIARLPLRTRWLLLIFPSMCKNGR